jgi:ribosomal protein S27AE
MGIFMEKNKGKIAQTFTYIGGDIPKGERPVLDYESKKKWRDLMEKIDEEKEGTLILDDEILYCPRCGKAVNIKDNISTCPYDSHPFNAEIWRSIKKQKDMLAAEKKNEEETRKRTEEENRRKKEEDRKKIEELEKDKGPRHEYAVRFNKCPLCNNLVTWEEKYYSVSNYNSDNESYRAKHPYCTSCNWSSILSNKERSYYEKTGGYEDYWDSDGDYYRQVPKMGYVWKSEGITDWQEFCKKCRDY